MSKHLQTLLVLNDPRLARYLAATDEESRSRELEAILADAVQPRVRQVVNGYRRTDWPIAAEDGEDIVGQVTVRMLNKLRAATVLEDESVQNLEAYVTTLTKNAIRDLMRRLSPERTRLKRRLRYLFSQDPRLTMRVDDNVAVCGLAAWSDQTMTPADITAVQAATEAALRGRDIGSGDDAVAVLRAVGTRVRLADLVVALCDNDFPRNEAAPEERAAHDGDVVEARQYLRVLWQEIRDLPAHQRAALLLNLREPSAGNAVVLFVAVGIATLDEIAEAIGMSAPALAAIWDEMPLDDVRIAEHLGVRRQQVINMRKSARERLTRRMRNRDRR
jgi:RNA polymerase sigma factor (sigma-70 family)